LQIGARGYVCLPEQLLALDKAIQHVAASRLWLSRSVLEMTILNLHVAPAPFWKYVGLPDRYPNLLRRQLPQGRAWGMSHDAGPTVAER
jgi:DNA-binding NarL/FixJ family response regulator